MKIFIAAYLLVTLSGCSLFADKIDKAAGAAGRLVKEYCENTTPDIREATRTEVNLAAAPHSVEVTCATP